MAQRWILHKCAYSRYLTENVHVYTFIMKEIRKGANSKFSSEIIHTILVKWVITKRVSNWCWYTTKIIQRVLNPTGWNCITDSCVKSWLGGDTIYSGIWKFQKISLCKISPQSRKVEVKQLWFVMIRLHPKALHSKVETLLSYCSIPSVTESTGHWTYNNMYNQFCVKYDFQFIVILKIVLRLSSQD